MEEQKKPSIQYSNNRKMFFIDLDIGSIESVSIEKIAQTPATENSGKLEIIDTDLEAIKAIEDYFDGIEQSSKLLDEMKKSVSKN